MTKDTKAAGHMGQPGAGGGSEGAAREERPRPKHARHAAKLDEGKEPSAEGPAPTNAGEAVAQAAEQEAVSPAGGIGFIKTHTYTATGSEGHATLLDEGSSEKGGLSRGARRGMIFGGIAIAALIALYVAGAVVFMGRFFPHTTINGEDASFAPVADVAAAHTRATDGYQLAVSGAGLNFTVSGDEINVHVDGDGFAKGAHDQVNPWAWPLALFATHQLTADEAMTYDADKLTSLVKAQVAKVNETATQPVGALASYNEETHSYVLVPEVMGTALDEKTVIDDVTAAVDKLDSQVTLGEKNLVMPSRTAHDQALIDAVDGANEMLAATQRLTIQGNEVRVIDAAQIGQWVSVSDALEVQLNDDAVRTWAQGELSDELDTAGKTHEYTRPDGKQVKVSGGSYGWVIGGEELARTICDNLRNKRTDPIEVPMIQTAETYSRGGQDWGGRYIDIDLAEQHVRFYDGGSIIWESDCVTGNTSENHGTPEGVYTMNEKSSGGVRLEGPDDPLTGQPEYVSFVDYWMPFIENAVALHDANWRYSFGGTIYQSNGSHGCVNLPVDKAAELYGICSEGDVVITHW